MYPAHIQRLQGARIDAANTLSDAGALCRELFDTDRPDAYADALKAERAARIALDEAEMDLSVAITEWRREGLIEPDSGTRLTDDDVRAIVGAVASGYVKYLSDVLGSCHDSDDCPGASCAWCYGSSVLHRIDNARR